MMSRRAHELAALAVQVGGKVTAVSTLSANGKAYEALQVTAETNEQAVKLLNLLAAYYAREPEMQELARGFDLEALRANVAPARRTEFLARRIQSFVAGAVRFEEEDPETFRSPMLTLELRAGDCDDHAVLVASIGRALYLPVQIVAIRNSRQRISHVVAAFRHDGRWSCAETTLPARYGDHPRNAARRLGLLREDVAA